MGFFDFFNLSKQCDACGNMVGGGVRWCPKCKICFCFQCVHYVLKNQVLKDLNDIHPHCPICSGDFESPKNKVKYDFSN